MNIVIPVAGEGIRLRPHTHVLPKSLLYVAGKPILGHILDSFKNLAIDALVIVLGAKGEAIVEFCERYPYNMRFVNQEDRLGLGHAIYTGAQGLHGPTMVLLGDTIIDYDLKKFCKEKTNMLAVKAVEDPQRFGIVEVKKNVVVSLAEKPKNPKSNLAIIGLYYFQHIEKVYQAIRYIIKKKIRTKNEYQLTDALKYLLTRGESFKITKVDKWYDCGTASALIETNRHLLHTNHHYRKRRGTIIRSPVYIHDSAKITNAIIGPHVSVAEHAVIENAIIRDSIINQEASVKNALLIESIVGRNAVVKSGFKRLNVSDSSIIEFP
jgi:glucose-1-phosphate thymidylyltransferase